MLLRRFTLLGSPQIVIILFGIAADRVAAEERMIATVADAKKCQIIENFMSWMLGLYNSAWLYIVT